MRPLGLLRRRKEHADAIQDVVHRRLHDDIPARVVDLLTGTQEQRLTGYLISCDVRMTCHAKVTGYGPSDYD